ncbi:hypothetical protein BH10ACT11_BH10ACT11_04340 [soil metagenome]
MFRRGRRALIGAVSLLVVVIAVVPASAGKRKTAKYNDERSTGKLYDAKTYARCDIRKLTATSKRGKLVLQLTFRGKTPKDYGPPIDSMYINTKGAKKSKPEYFFGGYDKAPVQKIKGFNGGFPDYDYDPDSGKAKYKGNQKGKGQQVKVGLGNFGKHLNKIGVQAQTCGEGAVDIAPGSDYFRDKNYDGHIKFQSLELKL